MQQNHKAKSIRLAEVYLGKYRVRYELEKEDYKRLSSLDLLELYKLLYEGVISKNRFLIISLTGRVGREEGYRVCLMLDNIYFEDFMSKCEGSNNKFEIFKKEYPKSTYNEIEFNRCVNIYERVRNNKS